MISLPFSAPPLFDAAAAALCCAAAAAVFFAIDDAAATISARLTLSFAIIFARLPKIFHASDYAIRRCGAARQRLRERGSAARRAARRSALPRAGDY